LKSGVKIGALQVSEDLKSATETGSRKVSEFDREHHISETANEVVEELKLGINTGSEQVKEFDREHHISETANEVVEELKSGVESGTEQLKEFDQEHLNISGTASEVVGELKSGVKTASRQVSEFLEKHHEVPEFFSGIGDSLGNAVNGLIGVFTSSEPTLTPAPKIKQVNCKPLVEPMITKTVPTLPTSSTNTATAIQTTPLSYSDELKLLSSEYQKPESYPEQPTENSFPELPLRETVLPNKFNFDKPSYSDITSSALPTQTRLPSNTNNLQI